MAVGPVEEATVDVEEEVAVDVLLLRARLVFLGFSEGVFMDRLITTHSMAIICWGIVFVGLVMLYRKRKAMIYFTVGPILFYISMQVFYISYTYFVQDTTTFDKIALLISLTSLVICHFLQQSERKRGKLNFFGVMETDDEVTEESP